MTDILAECLHPNIEIRRRTISNGTVVAAQQCLTCGASPKNVQKSSVKIDELPEYDYELRDQYQKKRQEGFRKRSRQNSDEFWAKYNAYLQSEHWRRLRRIVLDRDPMCQVCFSNRSIQVHHLSYDWFKKIGVSFACECVGICVECHENIHPDMANRVVIML